MGLIIPQYTATLSIFPWWISLDRRRGTGIKYSNNNNMICRRECLYSPITDEAFRCSCIPYLTPRPLFRFSVLIVIFIITIIIIFVIIFVQKDWKIIDTTIYVPLVFIVSDVRVFNYIFINAAQGSCPRTS